MGVIGGDYSWYSQGVLDDLPGELDDPPLVREGENPVKVLQIDPRNVHRFMIGVLFDGQFTTHRLEQKVVDSFVHPVGGHSEPVLDAAEVRQDRSGDPGLFLHLADRSLLIILITFRVALRQTPLQAASAVVAGNDRHIKTLRSWGDHDAARTDFFNCGQVPARAPQSRTIGTASTHRHCQGGAPFTSGFRVGHVPTLTGACVKLFSVMVSLPQGFPAGAEIPDVVVELGEVFARAGHDLSLVGGPVRDLFLGRQSPDLDFTTDATPDQIIAAVGGWADAHWDIGRAFGTIGIRRGGQTLEVTTYRSEAYDPTSRKPKVQFGESLADDLVRRDFTVNSMALRLPSFELIDPHGGVRDLASGVLRTPATAQESFSDDPLRMMRAARFASQLGLNVAEPVREAMTEMADRLRIVSAERIQAELVKLICGKNPRAGIDVMVETGLAEVVLPEIPALKLTDDEHRRHKDVYQHSLQVMEQAMELETGLEGPVPRPDFVLRFAALMHDIGKPKTRRFEPGGGVSFRHHDVVGAKLTRKRMQALKFDKESTRAVSHLVELHMRFYGYGDQGWTDSAVRRYVTDAGDQLERLHRLTRSDVTTRNRKKSARLAHAYDDLETRISELQEEEELAKIRPHLNGEQIMEILDIPPGPQVGKAYKFLLDHRMENGPLDHDAAVALLKQWADENP